MKILAIIGGISIVCSAVLLILSWLSNRWLNSLRSDSTVETDDPHTAAMVNQVWKTGKPHIGTVDHNGNFEMQEIDSFETFEI